MKPRLNPVLSSLVLIFGWLSAEFLSTYNIGSPWFNLGNGLSNCPDYIQWFEYTGVAGGTLWILVSNCIFFYVIKLFSEKKTISAYVAAVIFLFLIFLPIIISGNLKFNNTGKEVEVLIMNTKFKKGDLMKPTFGELLTKSQEQLTSSTKYVVWPESSFGRIINIESIKGSIAPIIRSGATDDSLMFVFGAILKEDNKYYNTAILLAFNKTEVYKKNKLVPFAEYNPPIFGSEKPIDWLDLNITAGSDDLIHSTIIGLGICYESLFGEFISANCFRSKGEIIIFISNEVWTKGASEILLQIASLRAIENRKFVLRSTNEGIGSVIEPDGTIHRIAEIDEAINSLRTTVIPNGEVTFYMQTGDYIGKISIMILALTIAYFSLSRGL